MTDDAERRLIDGERCIVYLRGGPLELHNTGGDLIVRGYHGEIVVKPRAANSVAITTDNNGETT